MTTNWQKNVKIVAAVGAVGFAVMLAGCSGGGTDSSSGTTTAATPGAGTGGPGSGGGTGPGMMPGGSGGGMGGGSMGSGGGMMGGGQAAAPKTVANNPGGAPPAHRPDPFKPWWPPAPPPAVISFTQPVRLAMVGSAEPIVQPNIEVHEVPTRRVAGILSGNGVYALIEGNGEMVVVKPGDPVGDYRVDSINSDSVVLKKVVKFGKNSQIYTQVVPLTDVGSSVSQFSGPVGGGGMRPPTGPGLGGPGFGRPGGGKGGGIGGAD